MSLWGYGLELERSEGLIKDAKNFLWWCGLDILRSSFAFTAVLGETSLCLNISNADHCE